MANKTARWHCESIKKDSLYSRDNYYKLLVLYKLSFLALTLPKGLFTAFSVVFLFSTGSGLLEQQVDELRHIGDVDGAISVDIGIGHIDLRRIIA